MTPWKIAMEAAAKAVMGFTETGPFRNVNLGARWVPRVSVAATIRALPEPPEFRAAREADVEMMREAATRIAELADDVEAWVKAEYGWPDIHPALPGKYDRDMELAIQARALLAKLEERLK